jgi:hypothetical protein
MSYSQQYYQKNKAKINYYSKTYYNDVIKEKKKSILPIRSVTIMRNVLCTF